jgi:hypothetical protein
MEVPSASEKLAKLKNSVRANVEWDFAKFGRAEQGAFLLIVFCRSRQLL